MRDCCFVLLFFLFSSFGLLAKSGCTCGRTYFSQRSQDTYQYLYMILNAPKRYIYDNDKSSMELDLSVGYESNFNRDNLSSYFFNSSGALTVGPNNQQFNVRASDLGLGADFEGFARLKPKYNNLICYVDAFLGFDGFAKGLWGEVVIPFLTESHWNPCLCSSIGKNSTYDYYTVPSDVGLASEGQTQDVVTSATTASVPVLYRGPTALSDALKGEDEGLSFGDSSTIIAGKICNQDYRWPGVHNLHFMLGYNFLRREYGNLGIGFDFSPGIGNSPPENLCDFNWWLTNLWQGSVGSQHRSKFGALVRGQYQLWNNDTDKNLTLYADGTLYGLFKGTTTRVLGLCAGNQSVFNNWLLLKKYVLIGGTAQYLGLERAANLLKAQVQARNSLEGQVNLMANYRNGGFSVSLGYNLYMRGAECLDIACLCNPDICKYSYVIKGEAPVFVGGTTVDGGFYSPVDSDVATTGELVDGSQVASVPSGLVTDNEIKFSPSPCGHINVQAAAHPRYLSNTIFASLNYSVSGLALKPNIALVGKVAFGKNNTAMDIWGWYIKLSAGF